MFSAHLFQLPRVPDWQITQSRHGTVRWNEQKWKDGFHLGNFESSSKYLITELKEPEDPFCFEFLYASSSSSDSSLSSNIDYRSWRSSKRGRRRREAVRQGTEFSNVKNIWKKEKKTWQEEELGRTQLWKKKHRARHKIFRRTNHHGGSNIFDFTIRIVFESPWLRSYRSK